MPAACSSTPSRASPKCPRPCSQFRSRGPGRGNGSRCAAPRSGCRPACGLCPEWRAWSRDPSCSLRTGTPQRAEECAARRLKPGGWVTLRHRPRSEMPLVRGRPRFMAAWWRAERRGTVPAPLHATRGEAIPASRAEGPAGSVASGETALRAAVGGFARQDRADEAGASALLDLACAREELNSGKIGSSLPFVRSASGIPCTETERGSGCPLPR